MQAFQLFSALLVLVCCVSALQIPFIRKDDTVRVLMIVDDLSEDYEVMVPFQILRMAGITVDVVSPGKSNGSTIQTVIDDMQPLYKLSTYTERFGHLFAVNKDFDSISLARVAEEYDGLLVPGGRAPELLQLNEKVLDVVRAFYRSHKPIGSQCHGPMILAAAGILEGRKCTGFIGISPQLIASGCQYVRMADDEAMLDFNGSPLITAPTWASHPKFMRLFLENL
jgi:protease I